MNAKPAFENHLSAADSRRLLACGDVDLRPRQHPLPAHLAGLAADRRAHHALHRGSVRPRRAVGPGAAEVFLPQIRHDPARADRRIRHRSVRLPRFRPRYRPHGHRAERTAWARPSSSCPAASSSSPTARASTRRTWRGRSASSTISRTCSTSPPRTSCPSPTGAPTRSSSTSTGSSPRVRPCSRTSPRTCRCRTSSA